MAKARARTKVTAIEAAEEPPSNPIDPLLLLWSLAAFTLAIIMTYVHAYPQAPYPEHAIVPSMGLIILSAAAILILLRAPWVRPRAVAPILLPCALLLWAVWRTTAARVPTEGTPLLGTLLQGCLVFSIALVLAAVGKEFKTFRFTVSSEEAQVQTPGAARLKERETEEPSLFLHCFLAFLLVVALGMALWAIYEFFVRYDEQFNEIWRSLRDQGRNEASWTSKEWAMLEMLRSKRVGSRFGTPNVLAGFLSMIAPLAVGAVVIWRDRSSKLAALVILGLICYVVVLTNSRGGMLTFLVAIAGGVFVAGRGRWRKHIAVFSVAAGVCAGAVILAVISAGVAGKPPSGGGGDAIPRPRYGFFERLIYSPTISQRLYYWRSAAPMIRQSPWLGQGLGSYGILYPKFRQPMARETIYPHNIFLHFAVELGVIGLSIWIAWVVVVGASGIALLRGSRQGPAGIGVAVLLVAAAVFVFNNLFEMTWAFREAYLDWCLILGALTGLAVRAPLPSEPGWGAESVAPRARILTATISAVPLVLGAALANSFLLCPMLAEIHYNAANAHLDALLLGKPDASVDKVLQQAQKMIRYQPDNPTYHHWVGSFYRDVAVDRAKAEYHKALELNPYSALFHADLAALESVEGNTEEARRLYTKAVGLYPLKDRYHYLLAEFERKNGDLDAARRHIDDALQRVLDARVRPTYEQFREELDTTGTAPTRNAP